MKDLFAEGYGGSPSGMKRLQIRYKTNLQAFLSLLKIKKDHEEQGKMERQLFMSFGLVLSLVLVIVAFQWKFYEKQSVVELSGPVENFEDLMEVPVTEQPPPPPPDQSQVVNLVEVEDEEIIEEMDVDFDLEASEETVVEEVAYEVEMMEEIEEEEAEEIFTIVEDQPQPPGGMVAFYKYVGANLIYPALARRTGIQGKVFVQFVVEKDGTITGAKVVKGIGAGCDEEAARVIMGAPKWKPGKQRGKPVKVLKILPIHFVLHE